MTQIEDLKLDTRPLYVRVEEALIKLVADCEAGDQLPPEAELAQHLGVSRATLREALRALEERDMIVRRHGVGTFVASPQPFLIKSGLEALESLDTLAARMGLDCGTDNLSINRETVPSYLAVKLHVPVSAQVISVSRTRITNNKVVAYMDDVVPASIISL
ncbi:MAG: GntR family transcriptional regulator, partial [Anaerolineae bacterium]|nr:GntR family transcriptional regulator [Anaerolineae bacterium]